MKKIISTILAIFLVLSLVGCGSVINSKGEPTQEQADNVIKQSHSSAVFKEKVESMNGDLYTFYYDVSAPEKYATCHITYAIEFYYNEEAKQWDYSPATETERYYDWHIAGTWYPVNSEYTTWYRGCVMTIGEIENDSVHITFSKDGNICFDETVDFNNIAGTSFTAKPTESSWDNIHMVIMTDTIAAEGKGTRTGCAFEKVN